MKRILEGVKWLNENQDLALDLVRFYLGVGLVVRGLLFVGEPTTRLQQMLVGPEPGFATAMLMHYVVLAHIAGGVLLAMGLLTRIAAIIQVPILFGAVFFVHVGEGLLAAGQALEFSALVLFLLVVFSLFGAGRWSADYYLFSDEVTSFDDLLPKRVIQRRSRARKRPERSPVAAGAGAPAIAAPDRELKRGATLSVAERCDCGHGVDHPDVVAEPHYGVLAGFRFMLGISAPVKEVSFTCGSCGTMLQRSREPAMLEKYRWHTH